MKLSSLLEVLSAAHLTAFVESPFESRGGLILVAPPGSLKTTIVRTLEVYPNAAVLSDINVPTLNDMRDDIANNVIRTLAFGELEKLYARHAASASNVEGIIKAMAEEGFKHAAYEDQRMHCREARCLVVGGMTQQLYRRKYKQWADDGFARRFVWSHFVLSDPDAIMEAIDQWKKIKLCEPIVFALPPGSRIEYQITAEESRWIRSLIPRRPDPAAAYVLLKKILCVLYMRYPREAHGNKAAEILFDFSESLGMKGATLDIEEKGKGVDKAVVIPRRVRHGA